MQSQVKKLAVICNVCFWLTIVFKYWKNARNIQPDVLNTIIILGMVAMAANLCWLFIVFMQKRKPAVAGQGKIVSSNKYEAVASVFNICSLLAQAVYLALDFL